MMETLGNLTKNRNFLKLIPDDSGKASILANSIFTLGSDRKKINRKVYDITPEMYKVLSSTSYNGKIRRKK